MDCRNCCRDGPLVMAVYVGSISQLTTSMSMKTARFESDCRRKMSTSARSSSRATTDADPVLAA